ncbi:MAG: helix-turn-helix transcriptional regulator [Paludibacter sp.]
MSAPEVCRGVAARVKQRRLELNLTQQGLASRADVNIETYRKFERTGEIAFVSLAKVAFALNALDDFNLLFSQKKYQGIEDVLQSKSNIRKRGKKL